MAWEVPGETMTRRSSEDLTAKQYRAVALDSVSELVTPGAGAVTLGVLQNAPDDGQYGTVMVTGITKMVAGAAITLPARVTTDNAGRAVTATTGDFVVGTALMAASGAGIVISVQLSVQYKAQA